MASALPVANTVDSDPRRGETVHAEGKLVSLSAVTWFFRRKARIAFLAFVIYVALC